MKRTQARGDRQSAAIWPGIQLCMTDAPASWLALVEQIAELEISLQEVAHECDAYSVGIAAKICVLVAHKRGALRALDTG
jgi:hypothetical protein